MLGAVVALAWSAGCGSVDKPKKKTTTTQPRPAVIWDKNPLKCPHGTERKNAPDDDDTCQGGRYEYCAKPDGTRHGPFKGKHFNGNRCTYGHYVNGRQDGRWTFFHQSGNFDAMMCWQNGEPIWEIERTLDVARQTRCD